MARHACAGRGGAGRRDRRRVGLLSHRPTRHRARDRPGGGLGLHRRRPGRGPASAGQPVGPPHDRGGLLLVRHEPGGRRPALRLWRRRVPGRAQRGHPRARDPGPPQRTAGVAGRPGRRDRRVHPRHWPRRRVRRHGRPRVRPLSLLRLHFRRRGRPRRPGGARSDGAGRRDRGGAPGRGPRRPGRASLEPQHRPGPAGAGPCLALRGRVAAAARLSSRRRLHRHPHFLAGTAPPGRERRAAGRPARLPARGHPASAGQGGDGGARAGAGAHAVARRPVGGAPANAGRPLARAGPLAPGLGCLPGPLGAPRRTRGRRHPPGHQDRPRRSAARARPARSGARRQHPAHGDPRRGRAAGRGPPAAARGPSRRAGGSRRRAPPGGARPPRRGAAALRGARPDAGVRPAADEACPGRRRGGGDADAGGGRAAAGPGRTARAGQRPLSGGADGARAGGRGRVAGGADAGARRGSCRARPLGPGAGDDRVLRRQRGADQHRQPRPSDPRAGLGRAQAGLAGGGGRG
jgi:hypothetical protein